MKISTFITGSFVVLLVSCNTEKQGISGDWKISSISVDTNKQVDSLNIEAIAGMFFIDQAESPSSISIRNDSIYLYKGNDQLLSDKMIHLKKIADNHYVFNLKNTQATIEATDKHSAKLVIENTTYNLSR